MNIIDIRETHEYMMGHIKDSKNIPSDLLELVPDRYFSKNKIYYLYCDKGIKSKELSDKLNKKGYNTYSINGGYEEWKRLNNVN